MAVRPRTIPASKVCGRCGEEKPAAEFGRNANMTSGLQSWCSTCANARRRERYAAEPTYRDRIARESRSRYLADPGRFKERAREWVTANLGRRRQIVNSWDARNREARNMRQRQRNAARRGAFVENVHPLIVLERDDGACGICGEDVDPFEFHVDHTVPLSRGGEHSYVNTQVAHPSCNLAKHNKLEAEMAA